MLRLSMRTMIAQHFSKILKNQDSKELDTYFIAMFIVELSNKFDKLQYDRHIITMQYLLSCFFYLFLHFYLSASLEHEFRN